MSNLLHPDIYELYNTEISSKRVFEIIDIQVQHLMDEVYPSTQYTPRKDIKPFAIMQCKEILEQNLSLFMVLLEDPVLHETFYSNYQILQELFYKGQNKMSPKQYITAYWFATRMSTAYNEIDCWCDICHTYRGYSLADFSKIAEDFETTHGVTHIKPEMLQAPIFNF